MTRRHRGHRVMVMVILVLAFALRLHRVDVQSFWSDEGNSVAMATRGFMDIVERSAADISPPLYYLNLRLWSALTGTSEFAVRALSVWWDVLTVALLAGLGRRLAGPTEGALAAFIFAISPYAVHYAQEARMYAMVTSLATASWLLLPAILDAVLKRRVGSQLQERGNEGRRGAGRFVAVLYVLLGASMLYTQYYSGSVLIAQNLAWVAVLLALVLRGEGSRVRIAVVQWLVLQTAIALLFLPWFLRVLDNILGWPAVSAPLTPGFLTREVFRIFTSGLAGEPVAGWMAIAVGLLLGASLLRILDVRGLTWLPLLMFGVPPLLMLLLSLDRPFWNPKFLLVALPGYALLLGYGAGWIVEWVQTFSPSARAGRVLRATGVVALVLLLSGVVRPSLAAEYYDPRYWRDDYRAMARLVAARAQPGDAVVLNGSGQQEIWSYYDESGLPVYGLPASRPIDLESTRQELARISEQHNRLWVLWWAEQEGDPEGVISSWLAEQTVAVSSQWYGNVRLAQYYSGPIPPPEPLAVRWTSAGSPDTLHLTGASADPQVVTGGDVIVVNTQWTAGSSSAVTFFAQLLDPSNQVVGQYDGLGGAPPVPEWDGRQTVTMGVPVPVGLPPGDYRLVIGAYLSESGQRFLTPEADVYDLARVPVDLPDVPLAVPALGLRDYERLDVEFADLTLLGARAYKLGHQHAPDTSLAVGDPFTLVLFWRADQTSPVLETPLALWLQGKDGRVTEWPLAITQGRFPPSEWRGGELVWDMHTLFLPGGLSPGRYSLLLSDDTRQVEVATLSIE